MSRGLGCLLGTVAAGVFFGGQTRAGESTGPRVAITPRIAEAAHGRLRSNIRLDVNEVLIPVTVTDALDRPVTSLSQDNFRILEDAEEQQIASFVQEDAPVSAGLVFDSSGSMKNRVAGSVDALKLFFQTIVPGDEFFVIQFSDRARLLGGFTDKPEEIYEELGFVQGKGWTALLDALALGTHQMKAARNRRRALLVLSDGNDNNSRFSESEVKSRVVEADLRVYAIGLAYRPRLLEQFAEETGGAVLVAQTASELPDVVQRLSTLMRSQYVLGYRPRNSQNDGKYHKVRIEVVRSTGAAPLRASWRHGYYAPGE
jgi:VWFA-related protein